MRRGSLLTRLPSLIILHNLSYKTALQIVQIFVVRSVHTKISFIVPHGFLPMMSIIKKCTRVGAIFLCSQLSGCQTTDPNPAQPGEVRATIVGYSSSLTNLLSICAQSWQVDIDGQPFRSRAVPVAFQQEALPVWIKYESDSIANSAQCHFVKFISIRKR